MSPFAIIFFMLIFGAITIANFGFWLQFMTEKQGINRLAQFE